MQTEGISKLKNAGAMNKSAMSKYILVYPHELADIPDPRYPWKGYSEDDYKNFMSDKTVQEYITAFNVDDPNYQRPYMVNGSSLLGLILRLIILKNGCLSINTILHIYII